LGGTGLNNSCPNVIIPCASTASGITAALAGITAAACYIGGDLGVRGSIWYGGTLNGTSDYRLKDNVSDLDETFCVDKLRPVTYIHKVTQKQDIGLIAHELQEQYPFLVTGEKDGEKIQTVNYTGLFGILIKEIKDLKKDKVELKQENTELRQQTLELKTENILINQRLDMLEKLMYKNKNQ
jgi:hypothetical protein